MAKKIKVKEAKIETNIAHIGSRNPKMVWIVLALIAIDAFIYWLVGGHEAMGFIANVLTIIFSFLAFAAVAMVYFNIDREFEDEKKTFGFLGLGVFLRLVAELVWIYQEAAGIEILLAPADILWYLSYAFILIGLAYKINKTFIFNKGKIVAGVLGIATAVVGVLVWHFFGEIEGLSVEDILYHALLEFYVVMDVYVVALLLILIIPMILSFNKTFKPYLLIALSFIVFAVYDFIYAEMELVGAYHLGHPVDILWDSAYILIFGGLFLKYLLLKGEVE